MEDLLIDPEDFPFTESEVYRAWRLLGSEADARTVAETVALGGRECRVSGLAAKAALARGSRELAEVNYPILMVPDELFALLATLSPELETRVERYRVRTREESRMSRVRSHTFRLRLPLGEDPPAAAVRAAMAAENAAADEAWTAMRAAIATELSTRNRSLSPNVALH